jgi:hypothetical protein
MINVSRAWWLVMAVALSACGHVPSSTSQASESAGASRVPGEYVVTLEAGEKESAINERYGRLGIKRMLALGGGVFLLNITNDPGPREMETLSKQDKRIKTVQPNLIYRADRTGNGVRQ